MKLYKIIYFLFVFFSFSSFAIAQEVTSTPGVLNNVVINIGLNSYTISDWSNVCFTGYGWADSAFDGDYTQVGTVNTLPYYINGNGKYLTFSITDDPTHYWVLSSVDIHENVGISSGYTNWVYNTTGITGYDTSPSGYTWASGGGDFTQTECNPVVPDNSATSTPDQVQTNLAYGIFIFILTTGGVLWTIKHH